VCRIDPRQRGSLVMALSNKRPEIRREEISGSSILLNQKL
jgi:hypothetical protein